MELIILRWYAYLLSTTIVGLEFSDSLLYLWVGNIVRKTMIWGRGGRVFRHTVLMAMGER